MKKIHGLLDDIVMEDENLDIVETNLSKEEKNRNVTMADSSKFLIKKAPETAIVTKTSMLTTFTLKAW